MSAARRREVGGLQAQRAARGERGGGGGDRPVDGREGQAQPDETWRPGAKRVDDRRERLRRRVPVEQDRRQRGLLAAP